MRVISLVLFQMLKNSFFLGISAESREVERVALQCSRSTSMEEYYSKTYNSQAALVELNQGAVRNEGLQSQVKV